MIELLTAIFIIMLLGALALPSYVQFLDQERVDSLSEEISQSFVLARSAAIKAGTPVVLCASSDESSCASDWSNGWIAFVDENRDDTPDANETVVLRMSNNASAAQIVVDSVAGVSVDTVRFNYRGAPDNALVVSTSKGVGDAVFSISPFGKPRHHE